MIFFNCSFGKGEATTQSYSITKIKIPIFTATSGDEWVRFIKTVTSTLQNL